MVEADVDVPKCQARPHPASRLPLPLHSWLRQWSEAIEGTSSWSSSCCNNRGHFPSIQQPPSDSRTSVDLEVVFFAGLQSTPAWGHTRSLDDGRCKPWWWEDVVIIWLTKDSNVVMMQMLVSMMTWCQDKIRKSRVAIMWADHVSGHVPRSYDW